MSLSSFKRHVRPHLRRSAGGSLRLYPVAELHRWLDREATLAGPRDHWVGSRIHKRRPPAQTAGRPAHGGTSSMSNRKTSPARTGIEERTDSRGTRRFRATVYDKASGRRLKGPWSASLAEARAWRVDALAHLQAGTLSAHLGPTDREAAEQFIDGIASGRSSIEARAPTSRPRGAATSATFASASCPRSARRG